MCRQDWFTVLDHYHRLNATISDLIMGNTYKFRVYAENKCGMSEEATVSKEEASIIKTGTFPFIILMLCQHGYISGNLIYPQKTCQLPSPP